MADRYPPGGCILRDKTRCKLARVVCCDHGRAIRWPEEGREQQRRMVEHGRELLKGYDCPDHPGPLDDARDHICRPRPIADRERSTCGHCGDGMFLDAEMEDGLCLSCADTPEDQRGMVGP